MDIRKLVTEINKYEKDEDMLERYIMKYYIKYNNIGNINETRIHRYVNLVNNKEYTNFEDKIIKYFEKNSIKKFDIDSLVAIYELLIPNEEKKINGMFFTPYDIKKFIIQDIIGNNKDILNLKICDPSCGCASFLITVSKYINSNYGLSYKYIYENIIYGVDIYSHNIDKGKLLLELLAIENGEIIKENLNFNLITKNSLDINFKKEFPNVFQRANSGFDIVIGNPPYVRAKNIDDKIKSSLENWSATKIGNKDLYIAFFQLGLELLNSTGSLGYISVNSYLTSLNGRLLREYLVSNEYNMKIINFKDSQIFKGVTSYTCINIFNKNKYEKKVKYVNLEDISDFKESELNEFLYGQLDNFNGWNLGDKNTVDNINKIRSFKKNLGNYEIKNGIATLKNDVYIFKPYTSDNSYYYFIDINKNQTKVEKEICRKIIKPNVLKLDTDINEAMEYIIYPYHREKHNKKVNLIDENIFAQNYPFAYNYLKGFKQELLKRDKGKAIEKYPAWYAFGRTQGMSNYGKKLLLPYMAKEPKVNLCVDEEVLFYCGYALFSDNIDELNYIQKILLSDVFWYYVSKTSKPYSGGYMSFAKNYIKDFSLPDVDAEFKQKIVKEKNKETINNMLLEVYGIKFK